MNFTDFLRILDRNGGNLGYLTSLEENIVDVMVIFIGFYF